MKKDKKTWDEKVKEFYATHDVIDDSKMPSAEECAKYKYEPEIDARVKKEMKIICKEFFG